MADFPQLRFATPTDTNGGLEKGLFLGTASIKTTALGLGILKMCLLSGLFIYLF